MAQSFTVAHQRVTALIGNIKLASATPNYLHRDCRIALWHSWLGMAVP